MTSRGKAGLCEDSGDQNNGHLNYFLVGMKKGGNRTMKEKGISEVFGARMKIMREEQIVDPPLGYRTSLFECFLFQPVHLHIEINITHTAITIPLATYF